MNAKGDPTTYATMPERHPFVDWRALLRRVIGVVKKDVGRKVCLNRVDLMEALVTLKAAAPDAGDMTPVFVEFSEDGEGVLLRCLNEQTGQTVVAGMRAMNTKGRWLGHAPWEETALKASNLPRTAIPDEVGNTDAPDGGKRRTRRIRRRTK